MDNAHHKYNNTNKLLTLRLFNPVPKKLSMYCGKLLLNLNTYKESVVNIKREKKEVEDKI